MDMKNLFLSLFLVTFVVGCSTTNRQIIIECESSSCRRPALNKPNVITSISPTNMTIKVNPTTSKKVLPKTNSVTTNSVTTNNFVRDNSYFYNSYEETTAFVGRYYIFE